MSRHTPLEMPQASYAAQSPLRAQPSRSRPLAEQDNFDDIDLTGIQPPPSALTSTTAYDPHSDAPSPLEDYPQSARSNHQRTLTGAFLDNCQPFLERATTSIQQHTSRASLHSPTKSLASFIPSRSATDSNASQPKIRALQSWFNGSSAPVKLGISSQHHDYSDSESQSGEEYSSDEDSEGEYEEGGPPRR